MADDSLLYKELLRLGSSKSLVITELKQLNMEVVSPCLPTFLILDLELLGSHPIGYAGFDKGFGGESFYSLLESKKIGYVAEMDGTVA